MVERAVETRRLLLAGMALGPLFLLIWAVQAFTREGFRPGYHPMSLLSLGELGWIQILNFVICGLLHIVFAVGLRRSWRQSHGSRWAPRLLAICGLGLIVAGVFVTDAGAGYPPGAPIGAPPRISWHGVLHEVGFAVSTVAWLAFCAVLVHRWRAGRAKIWAFAGVLVPVIVLAISLWPNLDTLGPRLVAGTAVQLAYTAAIAASTRRHANEPGSAGPFAEESNLLATIQEKTA
ncbi:hypothetical protein JOD64_005319 [Micromonospora luteifusca]|uniref:DUF998 domain-containing protein n=1 Tax=Micromonospora luteifusca TaxID=709860 RepID=A0ABS2M0Z9_9ACTN|nr:DUF998 domain-containing protein [Micromonospora luteifusca]MBM7494097.1 hypothetical protein [Micromonospora luteifusca]